MGKNNLKYFLTANSANGFINEFTSNYSEDMKTYIIKGGPGSGKSSFMKKVASFAEKKGESMVLCPCTSDPKSLDAVIFEKSGIMILDGTAPHTVDPVYPGVCEEILNFGNFWDSNKLKDKYQIINIAKKNKALHQSAARYIYAAGELLKDNFKTANACLDDKKAVRFALRLCDTFLAKNGTFPKEYIRFISGVTPEGLVTFGKTVTENYKTILIIKDEYFASSNMILQTIREIALQKNHKIMTLKNPILPDIIDHILIPDLSLAFVTENRFLEFNCDSRRIHDRRFISSKLLHRSIKRLKFNKKAAKELLEGAYATLKQAKQTHDELEKYYISAMNFEKLDNFTDIFCKKHF